MKALILSGGVPQAYLAKELKRRNIIVLIADQNNLVPAKKYADKFYQVSALDVDGIREIAIKEKVDYVLSVCADQMLLVAAQVSEELGLPCYIDYDTAIKVSDKEYMKQIFVEHNIPTSAYVVGKTLEPEVVDKLSYPIVVKPVDTYGSRGVKRVENYTELQIAFDQAVKTSRVGTAIVEEFVAGEELSVDIFVHNGIVHILCIRILDKIPGKDGFVICRGRYPAPISEKLLAKIQCVAQNIADAFHLVDSPMLIQLKVDDGNISVIEFSARTGGGIKYRLLPKVSGFDVVKGVLDLTLGIKKEVKINKFDGYIIDEFLYCKSGVFDHLEGFDVLFDQEIIVHYEQFKHPGHKFSTINSSGDRVAHFAVQADNLTDLKMKQSIAGENVKAISNLGEDLIIHDYIRFKEYNKIEAK